MRYNWNPIENVRPGKLPIQIRRPRTPTRLDRRRPGKPPIQRPSRTAAGPENPQTKSASVVLLLLLSSPHGKAGSAAIRFNDCSIRSKHFELHSKYPRLSEHFELHSKYPNVRLSLSTRKKYPRPIFQSDCSKKRTARQNVFQKNDPRATDP